MIYTERSVPVPAVLNCPVKWHNVTHIKKVSHHVFPTGRQNKKILYQLRSHYLVKKYPQKIALTDLLNRHTDMLNNNWLKAVFVRI